MALPPAPLDRPTAKSRNAHDYEEVSDVGERKPLSSFPERTPKNEPSFSHGGTAHAGDLKQRVNVVNLQFFFYSLACVQVLALHNVSISRRQDV